MISNLVEFLTNNVALVISAGVVLTFCYSVCYCLLWKDVVRPWWYKRKRWESLEIHPLCRKRMDTPSDQEWHVGALIMTSNDRRFLTEFFLENTKRVDDALDRPVVSPCLKPGSTVIGYKLLTHYPEGFQSRKGLMPRYEKEYGYLPSWELAVSKSSEDWKTCLEDAETGVLNGKYGDFPPVLPSAKTLRKEIKSFIRQWKDKCSGKSDE